MQTENQEHDCDLVQSAEGRLDIHAIGLDSQKRLGEIAEASFLAKASSLGFGVSKPWIEERYDFVLDSGYRFWRVQVKSTRTTVPPGYLVRFMGKNQAPYSDKEIDFAVAYLVPEDAWYVIPVKLLKGQNTMIFYPQRKGRSKWEKYREAWCQMACPYDEYGPSKIVTPRCRNNGPVQMAICPLKVLR
jgi:hypothetical protein